mmetsp:Transcript_25016/g.54423  ORF Transcript_25016/g.54423 Transcript_25016/m.54423 type:complete len:247 (-) Transcript_25016:684-1424(-)
MSRLVDLSHVLQACVDPQEVGEVDCTLLELVLAGRHLVGQMSVGPEAHGRVEGDGAPSEPTLLPNEVLGGLVSHQEGPDTCGVPEDLVEAHGDEVRLDLRQIQEVRRHEGCSVREDEPVALVGVLDPVEVVLHARDVALEGVGEELLACAPSLSSGPSEAAEGAWRLRASPAPRRRKVAAQNSGGRVRVHVQGVRLDGRVNDFCSLEDGLFSDAMYTVVIVLAYRASGTRSRRTEVEPFGDKPASS